MGRGGVRTQFHDLPPFRRGERPFLKCSQRGDEEVESVGCKERGSGCLGPRGLCSKRPRKLHGLWLVVIGT